MSDVIQLLEALAVSGDTLDRERYARLLATFDPIARAALLERDPAALAAALGGRPRMTCLITAPGENDEEPAEQDQPSDEPVEQSSRAA